MHWRSRLVADKIKIQESKDLKVIVQQLLFREVGVFWDIPDGFLIPAIPQRMNYLAYLRDELGEGNFTILDIGTGANLIFPILGVKFFGWKFLASDTCAQSIFNAQKLIQANNLLSIQIVQPSKNLLVEAEYDAVVCNPPFYNLQEQIENSTFKGQKNELRTKGGEVKFVKKLVRSSYLKKSVKCFSSMLGKKSSAKIIRKYILSEFPDAQVRICTLYQGKTLRWALFWNFVNNQMPKRKPGYNRDKRTFDGMINRQDEEKQEQPVQEQENREYQRNRIYIPQKIKEIVRSYCEFYRNLPRQQLDQPLQFGKLKLEWLQNLGPAETQQKLLELEQKLGKILLDLSESKDHFRNQLRIHAKIRLQVNQFLNCRNCHKASAEKIFGLCGHFLCRTCSGSVFKKICPYCEGSISGIYDYKYQLDN